MTMAENHTNKDLENKICTFLNDKEDGATALQIAKGVGLKKASDVNSVLYKLEKTGQLFMSNDKPPIWSCDKRLAATEKNSQPMDALAGELKKMMLSDGRLIKYKGRFQDCSIELKEDSRFFRDFELVSVLGSGGSGCVVKAKHKLDGEIYAVKILENTRNASREVKALAKFRHPNIVSYYTSWDEEAFWINEFNDDDSTTSSQYSTDSDQSDSCSSANGVKKSGKDLSCLFIQMEFCEKGTLNDWIKKRNEGTKKTKETAEALHMFLQILSGVEYIHSKGHIHRDLKPENVFIGKDETVKIGDFGHVINSSPVSHTSETGTLIYMSPEQKTEIVYDKNTDIFALGLICFEILWKMPTDSEKIKLFEKLSRQVFPEAFKRNNAPEHHIIRKMLSKNPEERPDVEEIAKYLEDFLLRESCDTTPQNMETSDTHSVVFAESTNTSQQKKHQDAKPKIKLAPNFQFANPPIHQPVSRFSTDFDSIERMGKGGFGHVYKARLKIEKRYYAVKIVRIKAKSIREVDALAQLEHCNIVRYSTTWMEDTEYKCYNTSDSSSTSHSGSDASAKFLYIQMELCDKTLKAWIDEQNKERDIKRRETSQGIIHQILDGVEYIHSNKLIHRDLKPSNIMFAKNGKVKIGNFGLATAENDDDDESLIERTKRTGTRSYMAPEQLNMSTYDRKVDIFALGLIFFELLWNLFTGVEKAQVWGDVRSSIFPKGFSLLYPPEQKLLESMLQNHPEDRPEAKQLLTELGSYIVPSKDQNSLKTNQTR